MDDVRYSIVFENGQPQIIDHRGCEVEQSTVVRIIKSLLSAYGTGEEKSVPAMVYLMESSILAGKEGHYCKIGMTSQAVEDRLAAIRYAERDYSIEVAHTIACESVADAYELETHLHQMYSDNRDRGEWFWLDSEEIGFIVENTALLKLVAPIANIHPTTIKKYNTSQIEDMLGKIETLRRYLDEAERIIGGD